MGVMTGIAIAGAVYTTYTALDEADKKKSAKRALDNLPTPQQKNVAENLSVSTLGADLMKEETLRNNTAIVDSLRAAGPRGIQGALGYVQDNTNRVNANAAANLDEQQKSIDVMKAEDNRRIQMANERRYENDVAALSSQYNSANDAQNQATANAFNFASSINTNGFGKAKEASKYSTTTDSNVMVNEDPNSMSLVENRFDPSKDVRFTEKDYGRFGPVKKGLFRNKYLTETN